MSNYKEYDCIENFDIFDGTFKSIKNNLFMRLFNKDNLPLDRKLDEIPYIKYSDLVITFSIEQRTYFDGNTGVFSYMITNKDIEIFQTNINELKEIAIKNILDKNSARIETINQHVIRSHVFSPLTRIPDNMPTMINLEGPNNRNSLFGTNSFGSIPIINSNDNLKNVLVLSNRTKTFAPINLIFSEVLDKLYEEFENENFYIVPSSVHELICIKDSFATENGNKNEKHVIEDLEDMVEKINDLVHKNASDILSYNIYYHIHDDKCTMRLT